MTFVMRDDNEPDEELRPDDTEPDATGPEGASKAAREAGPRPGSPRTAPPMRTSAPRSRPPQAQQQGCLLPALGTALLVIVLVVVALLLPPFSLLERITGPQYLTLSADTPGVTHPDGLTLSIDPAQPGEDFAVSLNALPQDAASAQVTGDEAAVLSAIPPALHLRSPIYTIAYRGTPPDVIALSVATPEGIEALYDTVDLYGWDAARGQWVFIPSQLTADYSQIVTTLDHVPGYLAVFETSAPAAQISVPLDPVQALSADVAGIADMVMVAGLQPTPQGTLQGSLAADFRLGAGYAVVLYIRNFSDPNVLDVTTVETILSSETLTDTHIYELAACALSCYQGSAVDGIAIDYRGLDGRDREAFSRFIRRLALALHANGQRLVVVVPAPEEIVGEPWQTGAYDWRAIGSHADTVQVLASNNPAGFAPGGPVERMLRWGVGEISRYKLQLSLSAHSFRQVTSEEGTTFTPVRFEEAVSGLGNVEVTTESEFHYFLPGTTIEATLNGYAAVAGFDGSAQTPYIDYEGGSAGRIWLTTRAALLYRMVLTRAFNLGGVALCDLLASDVSTEAIRAAADFTLNSPATADTVGLALRWTVVSASGEVIAEGTTGVGEPFAWEAVDQDGNYAINVAVVGGGRESDRAGQQVAVAFPTSTPLPATVTPTPAPTDTPTPTRVPPTPAPVAVQPTPAPQPQPAEQQPAPAQPTQAPAAAPPPPVVTGHIGGSFEIGGHVAGLGGNTVSLMHHAGMTWVKHQVRYNVGADPGGVAGLISEAHANGFRVLLGVVGNPGELGGMAEQDYFNAYAGYLAGVAALGADAIEVWNEMNIDREWPTGRIDPAMYVRMLAAAYNAIKSANGSTMVISGALAPTGAEAAFGRDRVWNDDSYYAGMAAAGAAQYADCIGAHYNEGIVPPSQVGNDPRGDSYPTRFLTTMTDRAGGPFGGQRPVCYTELGYLTPEGYGPLPDGFAWAANVTLAQQAAWLAEAAVINSNSGRVRLMIIWNVNFTQWGADPMAGYAMIRPGGACPACDTLHNVTG